MSIFGKKLLIFTFAAFIFGCSSSGNRYENYSPEEAKKKLEDMGFKYDVNGFLSQRSYGGENLDVVRLYLKAGMDPNVRVDFAGVSVTPLNNASLDSNLEIVKTLVEAGATIESQHLCNAAFRKRKEIVEYLVKKGADVNGACKGPEGRNPLWAAIGGYSEGGDPSTLRFLIQNGADPNRVAEGGSLSPIANMRETIKQFPTEHQYAEVLAILEEEKK